MSEVLVDLKEVTVLVNELRSKYKLILDGGPSCVFELLDKDQFVAAKCLAPTAYNKMVVGVGSLFDDLLEKLTLLSAPALSASVDDPGVPTGVPAEEPADVVVGTPT